MGKVFNLNGKVVAGGNSDDVTKDEPTERTYFFDMKVGDSLTFTGFAIANSAFIGIGDAEGSIRAVVPVENINSVYEIEPVSTTRQ